MMRNHITSKSIHMLAALLVSMCFLSCGGYDSPLSGHSFEDLTFGPEQSYQEIDLGGQDVKNISGKTTASWCQAYASEGKVIVVVLDNQTYDDRTATVTLTDIEGGDVITFNVTQKQNNVVLFDAEKNTLDAAGNCLLTVPAGGGSYDVVYQTNVSPEESLPDVDWITTSRTRGLHEQTASFIVAANPDGEKRQAVVTVKDASTGIEGKIIVTQLADTYIRFDDDVLRVGADGGTFVIDVYANIDFICETVGLHNWVAIGSQNSLGSYHYTQTVTVSPLPTETNSRTCELSFHRYSDLSFYNNLTILQSR